ncbi:MAG: hypothetical protein OEV42_21095, partial [Deltaproteobacteria bacterium]|nr:hypothetical protein [Deltaproteobacteria bacterium]
NEYDNAGNVTATTDAENKRTAYTYSGRNLLTVTTYADTTTESRSYDGAGNVLTITDEEGKITSYTYDKENRETSVTFAGEMTGKEYDAIGNLILVTKPLGNTKAMVYDVFNRLLEVSEGGLTTKYAYDKNSNVTVQMDALGRRVKYEYDALDRKVKHIQPGSIVTSYGYDAEGNLTAMTDAKGQVFAYVYDKLNRQTEANYPDVATPYMTPLKTVTAYDANNNVTTVTETKRDAGGATVTDLTENIYDDFDRLTSSTQRGVAVSYTYDNNGNRTSVTTASGSTAYTYDSRNRIETATADTLVTSYGYYADGKKDTVTYPNGTDVKYTYHPTNRVASIVNKVTADGSVISSYAYAYDSNGNRTSQTEAQNGATETTTYSYDDLDRMTEYTLTSGADVTVTNYTFEGYNRKIETVSVNGTATASKTYAYDALDRLTSVVDSVRGKTVGYAYDLNGNMLKKIDSSLPGEETNFVYDALNQMVQTTGGSAASQTVLGLYDYNADGFRVRHRLSERGDVDYFYDGGAVIEEHNAADSSLLAHYRYADRLLSLNTGLGTQYYHHDALGSTVNLTDNMGAVKVSYSLDPWGTIRSQSGTSVNRQIFTGQEHDEKTGLIYFGARYYDAETARFISEDTYLGEYGTPPSLHRYLYAYSNPTVYIDLYGYASSEYASLDEIDTGAKYIEYDGSYYNPDAAAWEDNELSYEIVMENGVEKTMERGFYDNVKHKYQKIKESLFGDEKVTVESENGEKEYEEQLQNPALLRKSAYAKALVDNAKDVTRKAVNEVEETVSSPENIVVAAATRTPLGKFIEKTGGSIKEKKKWVKGRWEAIKDRWKKWRKKGDGNATKTSVNLGRYSGNLVKVNKPDGAADALAKRLKGESRVAFASDPIGREFDVISDQFIAQTKPALRKVGTKFRKQAKATFEAAKETNKKVYFHFEGQPSKEVLNKISEYADRYGVEYIIDTKTLF